MMNEITTVKQNNKTDDFLRFLQMKERGYEKVKVTIQDELGITAEMTFQNAIVDVSPHEFPEVTLYCYGPIKMHYPEGVELI